MDPSLAKALPGGRFTDAQPWQSGGIEAGNGQVALTLPPTLTFLNATPPASVAGNVLYWDITQWPAHGAPRPSRSA
ncbi:MAG: hypothetical protein GWP61_23890 [Chloroflexi bacterium]|nr:hypothetical protein [Chloroflexota bacterium]